MDASKLIQARKQAEKAVDGMPDGDLKIKAFEVILAHLLGGREGRAVQPAAEVGAAATGTQGKSATRAAKPVKGLSGRIMYLREEGFFNNQRTLAEVREELKANGWYYPLTTLSPTILSLTQQRKLRREQGKKGNKKVWLYSNP